MAISFSLPIKSFAITRFPSGSCNLEGLLIKATNEPYWYFIINSKTNSETRFRLKPFLVTDQITEQGQFVEATINIPNETFSLYGEAYLKKNSKIS